MRADVPLGEHRIFEARRKRNAPDLKTTLCTRKWTEKKFLRLLEELFSSPVSGGVRGPHFGAADVLGNEAV